MNTWVLTWSVNWTDSSASCIRSRLYFLRSLMPLRNKECVSENETHQQLTNKQVQLRYKQARRHKLYRWQKILNKSNFFFSVAGGYIPLLSVHWETSKRRTPVAFCHADRRATGEVTVKRDCCCLTRAFFKQPTHNVFLGTCDCCPVWTRCGKRDVSYSERRKV